MLVQDIFIAMMEVIGATTLDEVPESSEMQKCLRHVNLMLDSWSARRLLQLATIQENFSLVANKRTYTIGVGGEFNTAKPMNITSAFIRDSTGNRYPVDVKTLEIYESYSDSEISIARPIAIYYDAGVSQQSVQTGTIYCYPIPDDSTDKLYIDSLKYFTEFVNLTDNVTFPPAYFKALVFNGAMAIWRVMGRKGPIPADIVYEARESMRIIETMNSRPVVSGLDLPSAQLSGGNVGYNIYTDGYS